MAKKKKKHEGQRDLFAEAPPDRPPSARAKRKVIPRMPIKRVDICAVGKVVTDWIKGELETLRNDAYAVFVKHGIEVKRQPENFIGTGVISQGSIQLKQRAFTAGLSEEEIEVLKQADLPTEVVEVIPERYAFNPAYVTDQELLSKINRALVRVEGLPKDVIVRQLPETRTVVIERTVREAFEKISDPEELLKVLKIITTVSVSPKLNGEMTVEEAIEALRQIRLKEVVDLAGLAEVIEIAQPALRTETTNPSNRTRRGKQR